MSSSGSPQGPNAMPAPACAESAMMDALVCATGLSKRHQVGGTAVQALADVSLTIDPGELVGVVGARVPANRRS